MKLRDFNCINSFVDWGVIFKKIFFWRRFLKVKVFLSIFYDVFYFFLKYLKF